MSIDYVKIIFFMNAYLCIVMDLGDEWFECRYGWRELSFYVDEL